jgi:hypothetical protein
MPGSCRSPIPIAAVLDEPEQVRAFLERTAPFQPVQRYFASAAEMRSQSGGGDLIIAPNFRGDWATLEAREPDVGFLLENPHLIAAAAELFDSDLVVPWGVYSNITWQLPFDQGAGHTDVPAFLGIDRSEHPTWFLNAMGHSGLFEKERIDIATAVSWYYRGTDGGFCYWPDGPDEPPRIHEGELFNTGIVGDNDRMYHRVRPVGDPARGLPAGLTLETRLEHDGDGRWAMRTKGETLARMDFAELRVSVSWKAYVYRDAEQQRRHESGAGRLGLGEVVDRLLDDLAARGAATQRPDDPHRDEAFVELLTRTYVQTPTVFDA